MIRIKYLTHALSGVEGGCLPSVYWGDCEFVHDANCVDYDWLLVYDDMPKRSVGTLVRECETLRCPREKTILVTAEPPTIKIYPKAYTHQFGYVLTTHLPKFFPHPNYRLGRGCLHWQADYTLEEVLSMPDYRKTRLLSTVCSAKQQRHTQHHNRFELIKYLSRHLPEMDWYGRGVRELGRKFDALNPYKYHIAVENYIEDYHWSDKISDPILGLCLTFYAGDPKLGELLPPESFIPIPINDHEKALHIIQEAIANNEYEKRRDAIWEARRRIVQEYNIFAQVSRLIHEEESKGISPLSEAGFVLKGRHALRRNPVTALSMWADSLKGKLNLASKKEKY